MQDSVVRCGYGDPGDGNAGRRETPAIRKAWRHAAPRRPRPAGASSALATRAPRRPRSGEPGGQRMPAIHFLDVTNRDGVQTARTGLSKFGKTMINFYLARLGVAQSELGFPFLFHEAPYIRANVALAEAGAFGQLRLSGWCRAIPADVQAAVAVRAGGSEGTGLRHYNLSISTSDQMIAHKFRGKMDRAAIIKEMTAAVAVAKAGLGR